MCGGSVGGRDLGARSTDAPGPSGCRRRRSPAWLSRPSPTCARRRRRRRPRKPDARALGPGDGELHAATILVPRRESVTETIRARPVVTRRSILRVFSCVRSLPSPREAEVTPVVFQAHGPGRETAAVPVPAALFVAGKADPTAGDRPSPRALPAPVGLDGASDPVGKDFFETSGHQTSPVSVFTQMADLSRSTACAARRGRDASTQPWRGRRRCRP